ncbi:MAG: hypothetical protein ACRC4N_05020, partial [Gammaproteobacteria bacterium]
RADEHNRFLILINEARENSESAGKRNRLLEILRSLDKNLGRTVGKGFLIWKNRVNEERGAREKMGKALERMLWATRHRGRLSLLQWKSWLDDRKKEDENRRLVLLVQQKDEENASLKDNSKASARLAVLGRMLSKIDGPKLRAKEAFLVWQEKVRLQRLRNKVIGGKLISNLLNKARHALDLLRANAKQSGKNEESEKARRLSELKSKLLGMDRKAKSDLKDCFTRWKLRAKDQTNLLKQQDGDNKIEGIQAEKEKGEFVGGMLENLAREMKATIYLLLGEAKDKKLAEEIDNADKRYGLLQENLLKENDGLRSKVLKDAEDERLRNQRSKICERLLWATRQKERLVLLLWRQKVNELQRADEHNRFLILINE